MRKAVFALLFLVVLLLTVSCEGVSAKKLSPPDLVLLGDRIEWEMVANASEYEIVTEEKTITTTNTIFYFAQYSGEVKVRCLGDGKLYSHSDYSVIEVR